MYNIKNVVIHFFLYRKKYNSIIYKSLFDIHIYLYLNLIPLSFQTVRLLELFILNWIHLESQAIQFSILNHSFCITIFVTQFV